MAWGHMNAQYQTVITLQKRLKLGEGDAALAHIFALTFVIRHFAGFVALEKQKLASNAFLGP